MQKTASDRNFTRGGQTLLHSLRMMSQIVNRVATACMITLLLYIALVGYLRVPTYSKYLISQYGIAKILILFNGNSKQEFRLPDGEQIKILSKNLTEQDFMPAVFKKTSKILAKTMMEGMILATTLFIILYIWLYRRGRKQGETQHLRGDKLQSQQVVRTKILKAGASDIKLAQLPMPQDFERGHVLLHGTTGTGKSVCIKELIDQIRNRGEKVIIYDKGCDFTRYYFRQETDILLNPLDTRSAAWHLWDECRDDADYDSLAAALFPTPNGSPDPFWINAARTIFAATARKMQVCNDRSIANLLQLLLKDDLEVLSDFLKDTEASSLVSEKNEKTTLSIKSVLVTYLKNLKYVKDEPNGFSIRQWIADDTKNNWLFVSSLSDKHESLKPLISMWLDIAANSLMSLTPSMTRRIWIILDELPSLHKLPYLTEAFAESRKFGGCLLIGMQSISQLKKIYGPNAAEEISSLCGTRIFFREPSAETAQWVAKELGQAEIEKAQEGISYSESAMRSGISIGKQQLNSYIVHPSDIMKLKNLEAYIRLLGDFPVTKIGFTPKQRDGLAEFFMAK